VDENCEAEVTAAMILNAQQTICPNGRYEVTVSHHGRPIPTSPVVTCAEVGLTLEVMIRDRNSGNSCWGEITVEDKLAPTIECGIDTLFCFQMAKYTGPKVTDNCTRAALITESQFPWGSTSYTESMDAVFGVGNWDLLQYSTLANAGELFSCKYDVIWMDGGASDGAQLSSFLSPGTVAIMEQWVRDGGRLFINASPFTSFTGTFDFGFGVENRLAGSFFDTANIVDRTHPIFVGPHCPIVPSQGFYECSGSLSWRLICPPGMDVLLESENGSPLLIRATEGDGEVAFGSLVPYDAFTDWNPYTESRNLFWNILHDLRKSGTPQVEMTLLDERPTALGCASTEFVKRIERDYQATDRWGNKSSICTQTIYLKRFPQGVVGSPRHPDAVVVCPPEYTIGGNNPIDCGDIKTGRIPTLPNGAPTMEWAGVPTADGIPLWPPNDFYCNITVTYEDVVLPKVGCVTKIMRVWEIDEWYCNTDIDIATCTQMFEIVDDEPPVIQPLSSIETTTRGGYECVADIWLPAVQAADECGIVERVDIRYPGGFARDVQGATHIELPVGFHDVVYLVYDDCYNLDSALLTVTVMDNTPPVAVCDQYTVVGLTYDSVAHVYAETFDDGTYDDCKIDSFAVRRMDGGANCGRVNVGFKSYVEFCCEDIRPDTNVMVIFRAYDKSGNYNDCMVEVEVQDKILPHIYCPPNITVSCDFHYDPSDLGASFGRVVADRKLRQPIDLSKDQYADADGELIDGHAYDNCGYTLREDTTMNINQCNEGTLTRTFTATDANGSVSCTQTITFENFEPWDGNDPTQLIWPADFDTIGCINPDNLSEDVTGVPIFVEDACDLVGYSFEDHVFPFFNSNGGNACLKIIRKWKVIDWCEFEFDPRTGRYQYETYIHEQVIKVNDVVDPFFTSITPDTVIANAPDTTFESVDTTCTAGPVRLIATAGDSCTPAAELRWEYKIDLNSNGIYEIVADGFGGTIDIDRDIEFGNHVVKYTFEDRCGNKITMERDFNVVNAKAPTPYCKNGIVVDLMPMDLNRDGQVDTGMVEIWASDLDLGSFGACGNPVILTFDSAMTMDVRSFGCEDVGPQGVPVEIWVTDSITGVQAFCQTFVIIQDNNGACTGNFNGGTVSGLVQMEDKENVKDASVELEGGPFVNEMTKDNGAYAFPMMRFGGQYNVIPKKDDMHLEGISTKDLILIQRHLLDINPLNSPYKRIAADVNGDNEISVKDIVELRKLILGVYAELPNNDAWRFVNSEYVFPDPSDPFNPAFPEEYHIDNFATNMNAVDFTAMKVGDVDNSVDASGLKGNSTRSDITLALEAADQKVLQGTEVSLEIKARDLEQIAGYQFTLNFDASYMEFVEVEAGLLDMSMANLGLNYLEDGLINVSWHQAQGVDISPNEVLFTMKFMALSSLQLSEVISINSRMTVAEAYTMDNEVMNVELNFSGSTSQAVNFRLYQNHPNPFNENTIIGFDLPDESEVIITIYDVTGKVVALYQVDGRRGYNSLEVMSKDLTSTGVLYYQLDTQGYTATKKMVVLQ
jgi:hypothetical protein